MIFLTFELQLITYSIALFFSLATVAYLAVKKRHRFGIYLLLMKMIIKRREGWKSLFRPQTAYPLAVTMILVCVMGIIGARNIVRLVSMQPEVPAGQSGIPVVLDGYDRPIVIEFTSPVDLTKLAVNTFPKLSGEWKISGYFGIVPFGRIITFMPSESYLPDEKIMVYLSNITKPGSHAFGGESLVEIEAPPMPGITVTTPISGEVSVQTDSEVKLTLSDNDTPAIVWDFSVDPQVPFAVERKFNNEIILRFQNRLSQATTYKVTVNQAAARYSVDAKDVITAKEDPRVMDFSFTTVKAPLVAKFSPEGTDIVPETPVTIRFDGPMIPDSFDHAVETDPKTELNAVWSENNTLLTLTPQLSKDTAYTVKLKKGIRAEGGGTLEEDVTFTFRTIGPVEIADITPADKTGNVPTDAGLSVMFNQDVVPESAQEKFSVTPPTEGSFTWEGRTMTFTPKDGLAFETRYTVSFQTGILSVRGQDSARKFESTFETSPERFVLNVPMLKQQSGFTCNIAATRMLLAYRGIAKTENELVDETGRNGSRGSGNPSKGYVSGYGTYWDPIVAVVANYRPHVLHKNWNLTSLLGEVKKGNPVMVWGQNGWSDPHEISWTASDGTPVYAINGMHSVVVKGFVGPADNPTSIIINDPWRGIWTLPTAEFVRRWSYFKVALVIQ